MTTLDATAPSFRLVTGHRPLLLSMPHIGTHLPDTLRPDYSEAALQLADTDWHLDRLYGFANELGASVLMAVHSRSVIDLNRPPDDESLYPGRITTGLCPTETFRGEALYRPGREPNAAETARRLASCWQPYHEALRGELARLRAVHGRVLLWDAHSIASRLPRLFDGQLPDLNLGTADGASCAPAVQAATADVAARSGFTWVVNGRFKGGYITRHHGRPADGVDAIQLELCQSLYMDEHAPFSYREDRAGRLQPTLRAMVGAALEAVEAAR